MSTVHAIVPGGIDDPARPSGGNTYDRRVCHRLAAMGWDVREYGVAGTWPWPDSSSEKTLALLVAGIPDGAVVLADGLIASTVPDVLVPESKRLRLVVLVHLPLGAGPPGHDIADARTREQAVLSAASAVVTTSGWGRQRLLDLYALPPDAVHVAEPGVDPAGLTPGTSDGGELLCVAAVAPHKGQDVLLSALARITDLPWHCVLVGSLDRDPAFVERLRGQAAFEGTAGRVRFTGALTRKDLARAYGVADVLVLASRGESYGMVVTEALAHGLPVIASDVGGVPEALGHTTGGLPGMLVPADDPDALARALTSWLGDDDLRRRLRRNAAERRGVLTGWDVTTERLTRALQVAAA